MAEKPRARKGESAAVPAPLRGTAPAARTPGGVRQSHGSDRLSVMPLAVLLPRLSDVSNLAPLAPQLERRLSTLQNRGAHHEGAEESEQDLRVHEESMLTQVLQWVRMPNEQD